MRTLLIAILCLAMPTIHAQNNEIQRNPKQSLQLLIEGNERYVKEKLLHPNRSLESRKATSNGQKPFATILGCSDSRVSPEIIFDQGVGDLFVVRVAGNVVGGIELDSIEYSTVYLGSTLILVLGHENCGAVNAVVNKQTKDIENVAVLIEPAVNATENMQGNRLDNAIRQNVRNVVEYLKNTPVTAKLIQEGKLDVVGGYYHLANGEVEILR